MNKYTFKRVIEVTPSPEELAYAFASWSDEEQARFFNQCGREFEKFQGDFQLCNMSKHFCAEGIDFIERLLGWAREPYKEEN